MTSQAYSSAPSADGPAHAYGPVIRPIRNPLGPEPLSKILDVRYTALGSEMRDQRLYLGDCLSENAHPGYAFRDLLQDAANRR